MESFQRLLLANKAWAKDKTQIQPDYFQKLAIDQKPDFLWIGCSDSRVPAEEVTGTEPGEIFVHRNIANLVVHTDFNLLSVLQYAIDVLSVKHVIVCGHYGCGGVRASLTHQPLGLLNNWLDALKEIYERNRKELEALEPAKRTDRLVELNVKQQVTNVAKTVIIQRAWREESRPMIHGWVFGLDSGLLHPVCQMGPKNELPAIFQFEF